MMFGIGKLSEEAGELAETIAAYEITKSLGRLQQLLGKAIAFPTGEHPDGKGELRARIMAELADVRAATTYFATANFTVSECAEIYERSNEKVRKFKRWGLTGIAQDAPVAPPMDE